MQRKKWTYLWYLLPLILGTISLLIYTPPREFAYQYLDLNCREGYSLYQRLYTDRTPIDVAFVGSSQTMCGISDVLLDSILRAQSSDPLQVVNLGQCRYGRSLHKHLISEVIDHFDPQLILLEVRVDEGWLSHMDFGRVADVGELVGDPLWVNHLYFRQIRRGLETRMAALRHEWLGYKAPLISPPAYRGPQRFPVDSELLSLFPKDRNLEKFNLQKPARSGWAGINDQIRFNYARTHIKAIASMCEEAGVELVFLYIPRLKDDPAQRPLEADLYQRLGGLWEPPQEMIADEMYWADPVHVNAAGMRKMTHWVAENLQAWQNGTP